MHPVSKVQFRIGKTKRPGQSFGRLIDVNWVSIELHRHRLPDGRFLMLDEGEMVPLQNADGTLSKHDPDCNAGGQGCSYAWWDVYQAWVDPVVMP